jgi:tRNA(Ile)-lysidine synthetase-like protein
MASGAIAEAAARVRAFAAEERLFRRVQGVLVAVSGGADSLAMLVLLRELSQELGLSLTIGHFDHQLRPDSGDDLAFVRGVAADWGIPFVSGEGDAAAAAQDRRRGIEEAARAMRYQFLGFVAAEKRLDAVVTGHTRDDQTETVLLRVLRGTGVRGLQGILPQGTVPDGAQRLLRPLLCLGRADTEAVCAEAGLTPRTDPSNADPRYLRNRVRHELLPSLRAIAPGVEDSLAGIAESAREVFAFIERAAMALTAVRRDVTGAIYEASAFGALPAEAQTLVIEREAAFSKLEPEVNRARLRQLGEVLAAGSGLTAFGDAMVEVSCGLVRIGPALGEAEVSEQVLNVPGVTAAGAWRVTVALDTPPPAPGAIDGRVNPEGLRGALRVRGLVAGDHITANGLDRNLHDFLAAERVPVWERRAAVCIADARSVRTVFLPSRVVAADGSEGDGAWFVRLQPMPATSGRQG